VYARHIVLHMQMQPIRYHNSRACRMSALPASSNTFDIGAVSRKGFRFTPHHLFHGGVQGCYRNLNREPGMVIVQVLSHSESLKFANGKAAPRVLWLDSCNPRSSGMQWLVVLSLEVTRARKGHGCKYMSQVFNTKMSVYEGNARLCRKSASGLLTPAS
jgi:hypothetical protein